jgi:hypothetical protein
MLLAATKSKLQQRDADAARAKGRYFGLEPVEDTLEFLYLTCVETCRLEWADTGIVVRNRDEHYLVYAALGEAYGVACDPIGADVAGEDTIASTIPPTAASPTDEAVGRSGGGAKLLPGGSRGTRSVADRCFEILDSDGDGQLKLADLIDLLYVMGHTSGLGQPPTEDEFGYLYKSEAEGGDRHRMLNCMSVKFSAPMAEVFEAHAHALIPGNGSDPAASPLPSLSRTNGAHGAHGGSTTAEEDLHLNRDQFRDCWLEATSSDAPGQMVDAIFGEHPTVSLSLFLAVCMTDCTRHSRKSFASHYCAYRLKVVRAFLGLVFYLPFIAIFIYFSLAGNEKRTAVKMFQGAVDSFITTPYPALPRLFPVDCFRPGPEDLTAYGDTSPHVVVGADRGASPVPCRSSDYLGGPLTDADSFASVQDWLRDVAIPALWRGRGASTVRDGTGVFTDHLGETVPIGAVKVRALRYLGAHALEDYDRYIVKPLGGDKAREALAAEKYPATHLGMGLAYELPNGINTSAFGIAAAFPDATAASTRSLVYDAFKYRTCAELNGSFIPRTGWKQQSYGCDGHALVIPTSIQGFEAQQMIAGLVHHGWYDRSVLAVIIEFYLFNIDADVLVHVGALFEATSTGFMTATFKVDPIAFNHDTWNSPQGILLGIFGILTVAWLVGLLRDAVDCAREKQESYGRRTVRGFLAGVSGFFLGDVWNLHAVATIAACLASFALRALFFTRYPGLESGDIAQSEWYPAQFDDIVAAYNALQAVDAITGFFVVVRILKYFELSSALAALTNVVADSAQFLGAIVFIFGVLLAGFILCYEVAYGNFLPEFSTAAFSAEQVVYFVVGEHNYRVWDEAQRSLTPVIFIIFQVLIVILIVNIVIVVFENALSEGAKRRLSINDANEMLRRDVNTRFTPPGVGAWLKSLSLISEMRYAARKAHNRLAWLFSDEAARHSLDRQLARLRTSNPRTLWAVLSQALHHLDNGSQGDAVVGAVTLAHACSSAHLELVTKAETFDWFDFNEDGSSDSATWRVILNDFKGPIQADVMLRLFVMVPRGLIGLDPSILLLDLLEYRREWLRHAARYSPLAEAAEIDALREGYDQVREWYGWAKACDESEAADQSHRPMPPAAKLSRALRRKRPFGAILRQLDAQLPNADDSTPQAVPATGANTAPTTSNLVRYALGQEPLGDLDSDDNSGNDDDVAEGVGAGALFTDASVCLGTTLAGRAPRREFIVPHVLGQVEQSDQQPVDGDVEGNASAVPPELLHPASHLQPSAFSTPLSQLQRATLRALLIHALRNDGGDESGDDRAPPYSAAEPFNERASVRRPRADVLGVSLNDSAAFDGHPTLTKGDASTAHAGSTTTTAAGLRPWQFAAAWRRAVPGSVLSARAVAATMGSRISTNAVESLLANAKRAYDEHQSLLLRRSWPLEVAASLVQRRQQESGGDDRVPKRLSREAFVALLPSLGYADSDEWGRSHYARLQRERAAAAQERALSATDDPLADTSSIDAGDDVAVRSAPDRPVSTPDSRGPHGTDDEQAEPWITPEDAEAEADDIYPRLAAYGVDTIDTDHLAANCTKQVSHRRSFIARFAEYQAQTLADATGFVWYVIFVGIFTYVVLDDRGFGNGAFLNRDIVRTLSTASFTTTGSDATDGGVTISFAQGLDAAQDWFAWVDQTLLPALFTDFGFDDSVERPPAIHGHYRPIGAVKIRQVRSAPRDCASQIDAFMRPTGDAAALARWNSSFASAFTADQCAQVFSVADPNTDAYSLGVNSSDTSLEASAFRYHGCEALGGIGRVVATDTRAYPCGGFGLLLPFNRSLAEVRAVVATLAANNWLDLHSASTIVDVFFFTFDTRLFAHGVLTASTTPGGRWSTTTEISVFRPFNFFDRSRSDQVATVLFLIGLVVNIGVFLTQFARETAARSREGNCTVLAAAVGVFLDDVWWTLMLINYTLFAVVWSFRLNLALQDDVSVVEWETYGYSLESLSRQQFITIVVDSVNVILCYLRVLYFFRLNAKVNILARTLYHSTEAMAALVLVFVIFFMCFSVAGLLVFASLLDSFADVGQVFTSLLLTAFGETDFAALRAERRTYGSIFFGAYFVISALFIVNLVLAAMTIGFAKALEEIHDAVRFQTVIKNDPKARLILRPQASVVGNIVAVVVGDLAMPLNWFRSWRAKTYAECVAYRCRQPLHFWRHIRNIVTASPDPVGELAALQQGIFDACGVTPAQRAAFSAVLRDAGRSGLTSSSEGDGIGALFSSGKTCEWDLYRLATSMQQFMLCMRTLETPVTPSIPAFLRDTLGDVVAEDLLRVAMLCGIACGYAPESTMASALALQHVLRLTEKQETGALGSLQLLVERYRVALSKVMDKIEEASQKYGDGSAWEEAAAEA